MREDIVGYLETVVRVEWPAQAEGRTVDRGTAFLEKLNRTVVSLKPSGPRPHWTLKESRTDLCRLLGTRSSQQHHEIALAAEARLQRREIGGLLSAPFRAKRSRASRTGSGRTARGSGEVNAARAVEQVGAMAAGIVDVLNCPLEPLEGAVRKLQDDGGALAGGAFGEGIECAIHFRRPADGGAIFDKALVRVAPSMALRRRASSFLSSS
jgi:hypothetical protein